MGLVLTCLLRERMVYTVADCNNQSRIYQGLFPALESHFFTFSFCPVSCFVRCVPSKMFSQDSFIIRVE